MTIPTDTAATPTVTPDPVEEGLAAANYIAGRLTVLATDLQDVLAEIHARLVALGGGRP